uniref:Intraflagellar transport protein 46 homolog n=1 Tax=Globodera pallida TaxID=36090 RepID=A0A183BUA5_GLOPA
MYNKQFELGAFLDGSVPFTQKYDNFVVIFCIAEQKEKADEFCGFVEWRMRLQIIFDIDKKGGSIETHLYPDEEEEEAEDNEEEKGEEVEGQKKEEEEEEESANFRHSNDAEQQPLSSYSSVSESVQNREFPGADFLSHSEEFNGHQKINSAQPSTEGYSIGYPTEPPPAYSSPRNERPGTSTSRMFLGEPARFAVPAPYEMASTSGDVPQEDKADSEEDCAGERTSSASNIRNAIGNSLTFAGGMAAAVLASPSVDDPQLKTSKSSSPRANYGVDSPRGDGHRQNSARVVQGARTVAELQQRGQTARARSAKGRNAELSDQQPKKENGLPQFPISAELKALFGHIEEYVAERVDIGPTWKPFQIDYIPAVGDVDPFIKVPRPDDNDVLLLGLAVLDEPATQQSDSAIVDLRLHQMAGNSSADVPVKKLSRADKNAHQIDRWVQSVKELRRTKAPTRVVYGKPMPSIEALMQEWPPEVEQKLKDIKLLLNANLDADLEDFVDLCLGLADIPVHKSRLESLHVLFSLYAEFRASQHFRNMALDRETDGAERAPSTNIDQFVVPE